MGMGKMSSLTGMVRVAWTWGYQDAPGEFVGTKIKLSISLQNWSCGKG